MENNIYKDDAYRYTWSQGKKQDFNYNLAEHWNKHRNEFPELASQNDYYKYALDLYHNPPNSVLSHTRTNGDKLLFDQNTNTFMSIDKNGAIRTMFRPSQGIAYWNRQR